MGITKDKKLFGNIEKDRCFYCGAGFVNEALYVYWSGYTREGGQAILMHPTCTLDLTKHLIKDALVTWRKAGQIDDESLALCVLDIVEEIERVKHRRK